MRDALEKTTRSYKELGVSSPAEVPPLFDALRQLFDAEIGQASGLDAWQELRDRWLSRKRGLLTQVKNHWLQPAGPELKRATGKQLNALRHRVEAALEERKQQLEAGAAAGAGQALDLTLPGLVAGRGARHLISQTLEEMCEIFSRIGFSVVEGPEVETDYYNFEALNIPADHPARDDFDTLYLDLTARSFPDELRGPSDPAQRLLLRTHTSPVQIRFMEKHKPPVRIVVPGKTYRRDNPDSSHSFMFHQLEGLAVDHDITFRDLKGVLEYFIREFFGPETRTRFTPSFFPFTEPSADVAASCVFCRGTGCRVCKQTGWLELLGSGMVDPEVFNYVGYDPSQVSGFAFGMGVERFAMLKYGVDDIQLFFQNDVRFLQQFRR
ncbi:MAG: phenylalanine--tRNA ligase subunit alpha [Terriglobia bacterium]